MKTLGIVGWRGMVGSVLMDRMRLEKDFDLAKTTFLSTSQAGQLGPEVGGNRATLEDANDIGVLKELDVIISCQGGDYTQAVHPKLRQAGWNGYWIDAASTLRMAPSAVIILDPVNLSQIEKGLEQGKRDFIGGNCTVSLMLMAISGLFENGWVEWISAATYQAASGAGARNMRELVRQMRCLGAAAGEDLDNPQASALSIDSQVQTALLSEGYPKTEFGAPLAGSLIPWIDRAVEAGQTREEWKGHVETNKILGLTPEVPVDGICVRVGAMRSHSQALTIKLNADVPLQEIETALASANDWVELVGNEKEQTLTRLSPAAASGTLRVPVGRLRKLRMGPEYLSVFTVGDQLLWGAAEPLRRMLRILLEA